MRLSNRLTAPIAALGLVAAVQLGAATPPPPAPPVPYADVADLTAAAPLVVRAVVKKQAVVDPARAAGVRPGMARLYIEAQTEALIGGNVPIGEKLRYLVDVPLDGRGKAPALKKQSVVLFARTVAGRPGELQLVAPDAQLAWTPALDSRLRTLLGELLAPGAPQRITGVREALHVPGDLAGAGETQLFLATANGEPAAITVTRAPGQAPKWSVSFSEVVQGQAAVPQRETLAWYRLACFLPAQLPASAFLSAGAADREAAAADYRFVIDSLGPCGRERR